jgi:hypothetical protein
MRRFLRIIAGAALALGAAATPVAAQQQLDSKVPIAFNRFYDYEEMTDLFRRLAQAYPHLCTLKSLGKSEQGRELWVLTVTNAKTGPELDKPAMYIDANIHGNEVQAGETVLYTAWYLLSGYGQVPAITEALDRSVFHLIPMVNPDGRDGWFADAHTPHSNRTGLKPTDNDRDGELDEDGPEDLDGDGSIGFMWRPDPNGTHRRSELDPNVMEPVPAEPRADGSIRRGDWSMAGSEGIDNDGDGRINEDGPGGYDMNRNFPADWHPPHVEGGAGDWPFAYPETRAIGEFILAQPNLAAGQAYHNTGGMILRGPGAQSREGDYPPRDRATYDAIAKAGEEMLPGYRSMVIWSDLYPVRGGFVNWLAESLGIVSYTNELWTEKRISQNGGSPDGPAMERWKDRVLLDRTSTPLSEVMHPTLGRVLVGGGNKWSSRIPPPFMLEEECHRNFAFTLYHAGQMPLVRFGEVKAEAIEIGPGLFQVDVEVANDRLIPTRTERAASKGIGQPDRLTLTGADVVASGFLRDRFAKSMDEVRFRPATIPVDDGIPGRGSRFFRFLVAGKGGDAVTLNYAAEKATDVSTTVLLPKPER